MVVVGGAVVVVVVRAGGGRGGSVVVVTGGLVVVVVGRRGRGGRRHLVVVVEVLTEVVEYVLVLRRTSRDAQFRSSRTRRLRGDGRSGRGGAHGGAWIRRGTPWRSTLTG